jgi:molybdenum cofactor cytidylyltransferase
LNALPANTGSVVFLLADQPQIPPDLVRALIEKHTRTLAPVIAPRVEGQRGNPVLFDRSTFPDLLALKGDTGGRAIFSRYPIEWIDWDDHNLLLDVDSEADYERLLHLPE